MEPNLYPDAERPPRPAPDAGMERPSTPEAIPDGVRERITEVAGRLAVLEERARNLRKRGQVTEQALLEQGREAGADLKALSGRLTELARRVEETREQVESMAGELGSVVKRHELAVLERYLDFWEPLDFLTREEAKRLLERR